MRQILCSYLAYLVVQLQGGGGNRVEAMHKDCGLQVVAQPGVPGETGPAR